MARPLRILIGGGWYHVVSRGNNRTVLFRTDVDRRRFLSWVAELPERFRVEIHAFVLMNNHYHLVLRTVDPNLSDAIRWLNVSYSGWFNWRHRQVGHVFQGRFKAQLIEDITGVGEVARYLHLNPVRIKRFGLDKEQQQRQKTSEALNPGADLVAARVAALAAYPWSSWRVYLGAESAPPWLELSVIGPSCGGHTLAQQRAALRTYTETPLREGRMESPWERLVAGVVLGTEEFAQKVLQDQKVDRIEHTEGRRLLRRKADWKGIVRAAEKVTGRKWSELLDAHGDWARDGVIYFAVRYGGMRLTELLPELTGLKYAAAAQAMKRFKDLAVAESARSEFLRQMSIQMSNVKV